MNNALLEVANGVWAILALWLTAFMIFHILNSRADRRISWRKFFLSFDLPISIQLAFGVLIISVGILITRGMVWFIRMRMVDGVDQALGSALGQSQGYLFGTVLGAVGFVLTLRTISKPMFGHWPWVGAMGSSGAYMVLWAVQHLL